MRVGIVGAEGAKFTGWGEAQAKDLIWRLIKDATVVVSGHCHLGGVDIWAEEIGTDLGKELDIHPPKELNWYNGYRPRNLKIAGRSDIVHCITVDALPPEFKGMRFERCYHCDRDDHIKSGGCWTMKKAKVGQLHIISNAHS